MDNGYLKSSTEWIELNKGCLCHFVVSSWIFYWTLGMETNWVDNKKGKSPIWKHFGLKVEGGKTSKTTAICKSCSAEVKLGGGTSNLVQHMMRHHPELRVSTSASQSTPVHKTSTVDKKSTQSTIPGMLSAKLPPHSQRAKDITNKIARFIVKDLRPISYRPSHQNSETW